MEIQLRYWQGVNKFIDTWYDILITAFFVSFLVSISLYVSYAMLAYDSTYLPIPSTLTQQKAFEFGIAGIGVTLSVGSAAALSIAKSGTSRKVNIRRVYRLHQQLLDSYLTSSKSSGCVSRQCVELVKSFKGASILTLVQVDDCSTEAHMRFEEFRVSLFNFTESSKPNEIMAEEFVKRLSLFILFAYGRVHIENHEFGLLEWLLSLKETA